MHDILLTHYLETARIHSVLTKALSKSFGVISISPDVYKKSEGETQYLIASVGGGFTFSVDNSIIILTGAYACPVIKGSATIILNSGSTSGLLPPTAGTKLRLISCGLSSKDTLTLSSFTADSAVVSLQRSITSLSGAIVEPGDYPISIGATIDQFSILASVAVLILTDNTNIIANIVF